jgi:subtilisin family serine protease
VLDGGRRKQTKDPSRLPVGRVDGWLLAVSSLTLAVLVASAAPAAAERLRVSVRGATPRVLAEADPSLAKVATALRRRPGDADRGVARGAGGAAGVRAKDLPPTVEIRLHSVGPDLVARLEDAGMRVDAVYEHHGRIYGAADADAIAAMAAMPEVATIHPSYPPIRWVGATTSQADGSIRAALARGSFAVDGSGVRVGILSDSYKAATGGAVEGEGCDRGALLGVAQVWGDLPDGVRLLADAPAGSDEGRAMAELIHDLAPGAELSFHTALGGEAAFADGIDRLAACGADVIVDDIIYFVEPIFQDGPVAAAAARAVRAGRPYFSAAGNNGTFGIDDTYRDALPGETGELGRDFHDFGGGVLARFVLPPGCDVDLVLQWNEPFDGFQGAGAVSDLDLYAFACSGNTCNELTSSVDAQGCSLGNALSGGDPLEVASLVNDGDAPSEVFVAVNRVCGADSRFRIVTFGSCDLGSYQFDPVIFDGPQVFGHAAAEGVVAVAAVPFFEIDSGGSALAPGGQIDVERFSSLGGDLPIFFDPEGGSLGAQPVLRRKPEIAAPDGTNTTFFTPGGDLGFDDDRAPNFFGTSAAAPHAAAVAALILERNPTLTPAEVTALLQSSATDIAAAGVDDRAGTGLIDAVRAVESTPETRSNIEGDLP